MWCFLWTHDLLSRHSKRLGPCLRFVYGPPKWGNPESVLLIPPKLFLLWVGRVEDNLGFYLWVEFDQLFPSGIPHSQMENLQRRIWRLDKKQRIVIRRNEVPRNLQFSETDKDHRSRDTVLNTLLQYGPKGPVPNSSFWSLLRMFPLCPSLLRIRCVSFVSVHKLVQYLTTQNP